MPYEPLYKPAREAAAIPGVGVIALAAAKWLEHHDWGKRTEMWNTLQRSLSRDQQELNKQSFLKLTAVAEKNYKIGGEKRTSRQKVFPHMIDRPQFSSLVAMVARSVPRSERCQPLVVAATM